MQNKAIHRIWLLFLSLLPFLWLQAGCTSDKEAQKTAQEDNATQEQCIRVESATVKKRDLKETISSIGTLRAVNSIQIKPELAGIIEKIHFQEGQRVKQGELLFEISNDKIMQRLKARQAALQESRAELQNAKRTYKRREKLYQQRVIAEEIRDEAATALEMSKARIDRLQAEIDEIKQTLSDSRIKAPFEGVLGECHVDPGDWVNIGSPLVTLVQTEGLYVVFGLPERHLNRVKTGQRVQVTSPARPEKKFSGQVNFVSPEIRESTRDILVKAFVENYQGSLVPGGFVQVQLTVGIHEQVPVIPEEALVPTRTGYMVFVLKDSRAHSREVKIGMRKVGIVEILQGLQPGEEVIRTGHISVHEGALCEPKQ